MLALDKLVLTDFALYREVSFDFEPGLTVIRGNNRGGKSLLFSPLKTLLIDEGSIPNGGKAVLSGFKDKTAFDISGWSHGKSTRFGVSINNKDMQTDTIAKGRFIIDSLIDIPSSLYATTIGLTGLAKHPLADGTAATRLTWIHATLAFSELYDEYLERVEKLLKNIKHSAIEHGILHKELQEMQSRSPEKPTKPSNVDLSELVDKRNRLQKRKENLSLIMSIPDRPEASEEELREKLATLSIKHAELQDVRKLWDNYNRYRKESKAISAEVAQMQESISVLAKRVGAPEGIHKDLLKLSSGLSSQIAKAEQRLRDATKINEAYEAQASARKAVSKANKTLKSFNRSVKDKKHLSVQLSDVEEKLAYYNVSMKDLGDVCTFCGKDITKDKAKAGKEVNVLKEQQEELSTLIEAIDTVNSTELVEPLDVSTHAKRLKDMIKLRQLCNSLYASTRDNKVVDKPTVSFDQEQLDKLDAKCSKLREQLSSLKVYFKTVGSLPEKLTKMSAEDASEMYVSTVQALKKIQRKIDAASDEAASYKVRQSLYAKHQQDVEHLSSKVEALAKFPQQLKILQSFKKAFGRDGIRVDTLNTTLELFISNLNALAPLVWPEPFKFDIEVGSRRCDVIVHRNKKAGSINSLSGSEQRGWQLVSALALLRILPDSMRCDTMILDELEANTDQISRDRFVYEFLPELARSVPKVVIVTPLNEKEMFIPADRNFQVVKKNAHSKLIQL